MVLLVIDTQKLITTNALYQFETFVSHEKELIKKAREKGIDITSINGSGKNGRITADDVKNFNGSAVPATETPSTEVATAAVAEQL